MKTNSDVWISSSKDLGKVLARARRSRSLSQRAVADKLGVTQKWISSIEQGKSCAWIDKVLELSYFLGVQLYTSESTGKSNSPNTNEPSIDDLLSDEG